MRAKVGKGDWVVVCDGRKALVLENVGDNRFPNLHVKETYEHGDASTHEQGVAPPGRSHQSIGSARSAVAQTDWHDESERAFLHQLAIRLDTALSAGETTALTLIAPPRALGMIREAYSPGVRGALVREISKDLIKTPVHEIEKRLFAEEPG
jgi:protein required for attachment to host cells